MEGPSPLQPPSVPFVASQYVQLHPQSAQQQTQPPPRQPNTGKALQPRRRGGVKRKNRWPKGRAGGQRDGAGANFNHMRRQNAMRSRRHFGSDPPWTVPRTAPRAPDNDNSFLLAQYGRGEPQTPTTAGQPFDKSQREHGSSTDLGGQLDFFGTNEGVVTGYSSSGTSSGSGDEAHENEDGDHRETTAVSSSRGLPDHIRVRLQSQSKYIAQLEEQNLDLQEKYSLLQYELQEARAASRREVFDQAPVEQGAGSAA